MINARAFLLSHWRLISIIAAAIIIVSGLAMVFLSPARQAATLLPAPPAASSTSGPTASDQNFLTPPGSSPVTNPVVSSAPIAPGEAKNVLVSIHFSRTPSFQLTITGTSLTTRQPNTAVYAPVKGAPYSLLRLVAASGQVLSEQPFSLPTDILGEDFDRAQADTYAVPESDSNIIVALPAGEPPARVILLNEQKQVLTERELSLDAQSSSYIPARRSLAQNILAFFRKSAQTAAAAANDKFVVVIISESGAQGFVRNKVAATEQMFQTVQPWKQYRDRVQIVPIENDQSLHCLLTTGPSGGVYPTCTDYNRIDTVVAATIPRWDVIIVVVPYSCNCGMASPGYIAAGTAASGQTIIHELGHAVGKMMDEYLYQYRISRNILGPNCFESENACRTATTAMPQAQCALGCSSTVSWRPSSRIMHNTYDVLEYGPLEECLMGTAIAQVLGEQYNCVLPSPNPSDGYWGWHR